MNYAIIDLSKRERQRRRRSSSPIIKNGLQLIGSKRRLLLKGLQQLVCQKASKIDKKKFIICSQKIMKKALTITINCDIIKA